MEEQKKLFFLNLKKLEREENNHDQMFIRNL